MAENIVAASFSDQQQIEKMQAEHNEKIQSIFNRLESECLKKGRSPHKEDQLDIRYRLKMPIAVSAEAMWEKSKQTNRGAEWQCRLNQGIGEDIAYKHQMVRFSYNDEQRQNNPALAHTVDIATVYQIQQQFYAWTDFEVDISQFDQYRNYAREWEQIKAKETLDFGDTKMGQVDDIHFVLALSSGISDGQYQDKAKTSCSYDTIFPNISCDAKGNVAATREQVQTMLDTLQIPCDINRDFDKPKPLANNKNNHERG